MNTMMEKKRLKYISLSCMSYVIKNEYTEMISLRPHNEMCL